MKFKITLKHMLLVCCVTTFIIYFITISCSKPELIINKMEQFTTKASDYLNNSEEFETSKYSVIILVQVHDRIKYLRELINSLSKVSNINSTLIIFSHDLVDEKINNLIRNITFCEVLQIYYPYSIQKFPHQFPGEDPNDCPRDLTKAAAIEKNCNSAQFPDKYNHYRESKLCQIKHHWWWKANYVLDSMEVTRNHTGLFLFLEDDLYVLPDLVQVSQKMDVACRKREDCMGLVLGGKDRVICPAGQLRVVLQKKMGSIGFAMYRKTWELFKTCSHAFCTFDEYNWDFSIFYIMKKCLKDNVSLMFTDCSPRVLHLGVCGIHTSGNNCVAAFNSLLKTFKGMVNNLNPDTINVLNRGAVVKTPTGTGGWADPRDHELCLSMVNNDITSDGLNKNFDAKQVKRSSIT